MSAPRPNPFNHLLRELPEGGTYYSIAELAPETVRKLPYCIRVLLENAVRNCDEFSVKKADVENVLNWEVSCAEQREFAYKPARVVLQDFTGVPSCVDLAAMRDCLAKFGKDVTQINPLVPADLIIDHSVQVDSYGSSTSLEVNQSLEFERNKERFQFLKWAAGNFDNMLIAPPGSGIVHQVNLEYLARVVFQVPTAGLSEKENQSSAKTLLFPDTTVGTDSHTTMIGGLGVLGWGVGGIEAEAVMLGQPISMVLPEVQGFELTGVLPEVCTATDLVLTVTSMLRAKGVVGKLVEFFGDGIAQLTLADRATISNMSPEYGATCGFFPVDEQTVAYLRLTGRDEKTVNNIERYLRANALFRSLEGAANDQIRYTGEVLRLDLSTVVPCVSGPKRPQDWIELTKLREDFLECLTAKVGFKGFGIAPERAATSSEVQFKSDLSTHKLEQGSVVIAAITSCTNTSNASVMLGAALLARNAVERNLKVPPFVKTSLSPGSGVVDAYLKFSGLLPYLESLGFYTTGFGCQTCIGNSGDLLPEIAEAIASNPDLVVASVLSGNRNFEGRVHPLTRANYLASPMLVVAYALAGNVTFDFEKQPLGTNSETGEQVYLRDIWPARSTIREIENRVITPAMYKQVYDKIASGGNKQWQSLPVEKSPLFKWSADSTYIHDPPFFQDMELVPTPLKDIRNARLLCLLGDSITTDHISPAGSIAKTSPAAVYLSERGVPPKDFNSYGSRRGNDQIMSRGTFANIRLINNLSPKPGPYTTHIPSGEVLSIFDAAQKYKSTETPLLIIAGREYGAGSSRDWAAKGPWMLGVKAVIARSFERIHRTNLVGMGILPLQFKEGESAETLKLTGEEEFSIALHGGQMPVQGDVTIDVTEANGTSRTFTAHCRIDTEVELEYFKHGGILRYVLRRLAASEF